jgi:hypothetical protein
MPYRLIVTGWMPYAKAAFLIAGVSGLSGLPAFTLPGFRLPRQARTFSELARIGS